MAELDRTPAPTAKDMVDYVYLRELPLQPSEKSQPRRILTIALMLAAPILSAAAYLTADYLVREKKEAMTSATESHARLVTGRNVDVMQTQLDSIARHASRIVDDRAIKHYLARPMASYTAGAGNPFAPHLPHLRADMADFAAENDLEAAYLINLRREVVLTSPQAPPLPPHLLKAAGESLASQERAFLPIVMDGPTLMLDIVVPVHNFEDADNPATRRSRVTGQPQPLLGVLVMRLPAEPLLSRTLAESPHAQPGENIGLFHVSEKEITLVQIGKQRGIYAWRRGQDKLATNAREWQIIFGTESRWEAFTRSIQAGQALLPPSSQFVAVRQPVPGTPYNLVTMVTLSEALAPLLGYSWRVHLTAQLIALSLLLAGLAFWWQQQEGRQHALAEQYRDFANKANTQRRLLHAINNVIREQIGLKTLDGRYIYANPALASAVGQTVDKVVGSNDITLFGADTAHKMAELEANVKHKKGPVTGQITLRLNDERRHWAMSKAPFHDASGEMIGIVSVARDITDLVIERKLREKATKNSVAVLLRVMERHDPVLVRRARHLRRMALALADKMGLNMTEKMTLETCANLAQIGKVFIPTQILQKSAPLTKEERILMQTHIENAVFIADSVAWGDLPVVATLYRMYERLDGSGYPNGVKAERIGKLARVLAVADAFTAMISPRPGRPLYTPEQAIKQLVARKKAYDIHVILHLAEVVAEQAEELLVA